MTTTAIPIIQRRDPQSERRARAARRRRAARARRPARRSRCAPRGRCRSGRRSVGDVPQDTPTLLFEFEAAARARRSRHSPSSRPGRRRRPRRCPSRCRCCCSRRPRRSPRSRSPSRAAIAEAAPRAEPAPRPRRERPAARRGRPRSASSTSRRPASTPSTARIVTAHVGLIDETGAVVERKDWIVNPGVPIPEGAAAVHGITDERAQRFGRPPGEVVAEILAAIRSVFLRGFPLVVYNAPYDLTLLAAEADRHRLWPLETTAPIVDPFVLDKEVDRFRKGKRTLTAATEVYGVALTDAHDAGADAIAAGRLAQAIARRYPDVLAWRRRSCTTPRSPGAPTRRTRFQAYMREKRDPDFTTSRRSWPASSAVDGTARIRLERARRAASRCGRRPFERSSRGLLAEVLEALVELLHAAGGVEDALLARVERVRRGGDLDVDHRVGRRRPARWSCRWWRWSA